jgi:hypothetical protein
MKMILLGSLLLLAGADPVSREEAGAEEANSGTAAGCVHWETEARWSGYAYNHLVHLDSGCGETMRCIVTTNVNPDPVTADLDPGEKETVTTFLGSPASEFSASVTCKPAPTS